MKSKFATRMSDLRKETGLSQRGAAEKLGISQALLSHYENDAREPKFEFVSIACDYYNVTADYLLGRTDERESGDSVLSEKVREIVDSLNTLKQSEAELIKQLAELTRRNKKT